MKQIPLTKGYFALVDDEDYERLSAYNWQAKVKPNGSVYAVRANDIRGKTPIKMHQMLIDCLEGFTPDHINGNGIDNQKHNLRPATAQQQQYNKGSHSGSSSKYKGVSWDCTRNRWQAIIQINGKLKKLGKFKIEEDAARAYNAVAKQLHGEFARLNFQPRTNRGNN